MFERVGHGPWHQKLSHGRVEQVFSRPRREMDTSHVWGMTMTARIISVASIATRTRFPRTGPQLDSE